jgi:hypothetical protein
MHGTEWLQKHFEPLTQEKANREWYMLIFDGHNSHISNNWFAHCLKNKILPVLLVPHLSYLT